MISDLFAILIAALVCFLFWQQRKQSEMAKQAITRKCAQMDLQVLSIAFSAHRFRDKQKRFYWHTVYQFEFSSLGDDCYEGELVMQGFFVRDYRFPPHRYWESDS